MAEDSIKNGAFEGANAANPDVIAKLLSCVMSWQSDDQMMRPPMLRTSASWHKKKQVSEYIEENIKSFKKWAYQQADKDKELLQETDNYINGLYEWLKQGRKENQLDNFEQQRLKVQKEILIEKLSGTASDKTGDNIKAIQEKQEGVLEPKPPEFLQKLLWIMKYGRRHWKLLLLAILILLIFSIFVLPKFDLFSRLSNSEIWGHQ